MTFFAYFNGSATSSLAGEFEEKSYLQKPFFNSVLILSHRKIYSLWDKL
jgi:hypothetical protein